MTSFEQKVGRDRRFDEYLQRLGVSGDPFRAELGAIEAFAPAQRLDLLKLKWVLTDGKVGVLTGGLGMGKTTVCEFLVATLREESMISQDPSKQVIPVFIHGATYKSTDELLRAMILSLEMDANKSRALLFSTLKRWHQEHRERLAIVIDDVSEIGAEVREIGEFLRVLADIPGISLLLNGEPSQMERFLDAMPPLKDRVQVRVELKPMNPHQLEELILLRLKTAGCTEWDKLIAPGTFEALYKVSRGIPRRALKAASNALRYAAWKNVPIDARAVRDANRRPLRSRIFG